MAQHSSPWTPSAEKLRLLLDPRDPADDNLVTWLAIAAAQAGHLDRLADLIHRHTVNVMRDAGSVARHECLAAVQAVIEEIEGPRDAELTQLEADQAEGDRRRGES